MSKERQQRFTSFFAKHLMWPYVIPKPVSVAVWVAAPCWALAMVLFLWHARSLQQFELLQQRVIL